MGFVPLPPLHINDVVVLMVFIEPEKSRKRTVNVMEVEDNGNACNKTDVDWCLVKFLCFGVLQLLPRLQPIPIKARRIH